MRLKINNACKTKKLKLIKTSLLIGSMIPIVFAGCNDIDISNYYLVHNEGNYYICEKLDRYINSCDFEYKSIVDGKIVGVVCCDNNNFDYQKHRLSTEFLCELQFAPISEVLVNDSFSYDDLKTVASSDVISIIGDNFFQNKKYFFESNFESFNSSSLQIYKLNNHIVFGYDVSPERLNSSNDYIYSIIDNDVVKLSDYNVENYDITKYYNDTDYITYDIALELSNDKKLEKVLQK